MGKHHYIFLDLTGQVFNRLTVLFRAEDTTKDGQRCWYCKCQCGQEKSIREKNLKRGLTQSCGCLKKERTGDANRRHGLTGTPEHVSWVLMKRRCYNQHEPKYPYYGGRGITVCDRWRESFENFYADMGKKPSPHHTLERLRNFEGYFPGNVIWADKKTQARNTRRNHLITIGSVTKPMAAWAEEKGHQSSTIRQRFQ